jgi:choline dehydrogenase
MTTTESQSIESHSLTGSDGSDFVRRARGNQNRLASALSPEYDVVVCGAGSSGSVVARRLAENPDVAVLLLEAGSDDDVPSVMDPRLWPTNLGTDRDWGFVAEPNHHLNNRAISMSMGKVLGGGSSINVMNWARGHESDWEFFASESGDSAWSYESVLDIYRGIENWTGAPDPIRRGTGGLVHVEPVPDPHACAAAAIESAHTLGMPTFDSPNGEMMEGTGGAARLDVRIKDGQRQSVFRSYVYPVLDRPNLTVLNGAVVRRLVLENQRATGVEFSHRATVYRVAAQAEVVLSLGAINTPKVLMQSGIGDEKQLRDFGIPVTVHLPGVGKNFQDHQAFPLVWEFPSKWDSDSRGQACMYWTSRSGLDSPDLYACLSAIPFGTPETAARYPLPEKGWFLFGALTQPKSRGTVTLTGPGPDDPIRINANGLSHPDDLATSRLCVEALREIGNSSALRPFVRHEVMPGDLTGKDLDTYLRDSASSFWHQVGTAKMGRDPMSVVDGELKVYGVEGLRVADGSVMPRLTTGPTMAPCVVIGERAAQALNAPLRGGIRTPGIRQNGID